VMLDVMIFITSNLANGTYIPYQRPDFEVPPSAITVNCLFFASLSISLVAALASVVALQWVADYDAAITRGGSSPEDRAKRRQFRYAGVVRWKMSEIIASLPLLLYFSVFLFFSGLILWMWVVHPTVGLVVAGGLAIAVLFYGVFVTLSVAFVSAPFRTPLARWIYSLVHVILSMVYSLAQFLRVRRIPAWLREHCERCKTAEGREDDEVERRSGLGMDSLVWLANHLSVSQDSYERFLLLANELRKQDLNHFLSPGFKEAPWFSIFDLLAWKYLKVDASQEMSADETRAVAILAHCYRIPAIYEIIRPRESVPYCSDDTQDEYWSQYCEATGSQWCPASPSSSPNSLFLLLRDIPLPSRDTARQLEFTMQLSHWRNSPVSEFKVRRQRGTASSSSPDVFVRQYIKTNEQDLWFTRDDASLYNATVGRMVQLCIESDGKLPPGPLDLLRWRHESMLLGGHNISATSCLSSPLRYQEALQTDMSMHYGFTLLLARNINTFSGVERARRVKELLTMMRIASKSNNGEDKRHETDGMESFYDANPAFIMEWIQGLETIRHISEILEHLAVAQSSQPNIGPLWRVVTPQTHAAPRLVDVLEKFDMLRGISPQEHLALINLVCQDIELGPREAFVGYISTYRLGVIENLKDPCLRFLGKLVADSNPRFGRGWEPLKASWARIARHITNHYKNTSSSTILQLQAAMWCLKPDESSKSALKDYGVLVRFLFSFVFLQLMARKKTHLQRIFEYYVQCGHSYTAGQTHLLHHIFKQIPRFYFPVEIPSLTKMKMTGRALHTLVTVIILFDGHRDLLQNKLRKHFDERCLDEVMEMVGVLTKSQYLLLAILLSAGAELDWPGDVISFPICVNKALDLPNDHRSTPLILPLVGHMRRRVPRITGDPRQEAIASAESEQTIQRLYTCLASMMVFGGRHRRILSCARTREAFSPAVGWMAVYTGL